MAGRLSILLVALVVVAETASGAESMRCRSRLVTDGDPKAKVADLCGEPTYIERRAVYRSGIPRRRISSGNDDAASDSELLIHVRSHVEVIVDVWVYNLGSTRLMREVVFENSRIVEINSLGRGY